MGKKAKTNIRPKKKSSFLQNDIHYIDKIISFGLIIGVMIIPLLIRLNRVEFISPKITESYYFASGGKFELFSHDKFIFLVILTSILALLFLYKIFVLNYEVNVTYTNIFTTLFMVILVLSSVFSSYKSISLFGTYLRFEGSLTYLCYTILFFIGSNIKINRKTLKFFLYALIPFTIINAIMGLINFYGINILDWEFIRNLVYGKYANEQVMSENSRLLGTLNQWNYLSGVSSLLICAFFILTVFCRQWKLRLFYIILLYSSFVILLASLSNSGFFTIVLLIPLFLVLLIKKKRKQEFVTGIILFLSLFIIFIPLQLHNDKVWNETFGNFINILPIKTEKVSVDSVESMKGTNFKNNNKIDLNEDGFLPSLPKPGYTWGSGRGYIWATTIPLILERPVLGYGLDTFAFHFPQNDENMIGGMGSMVQIDKPHSLYLDIAFGTGILGMVIFLIMVLIPIGKSMKNIFLNKDPFNDVEVIAITFLLIAYMVQGVVNDSIIGVSVIFYIFLGVLHSIVNYNQLKEVKAININKISER